MASVIILGERITEIDYSIMGGRIRSFLLQGEKLYDESNNTNIPGWKDVLCALVVEKGLNQDKDGYGLPAFVYRLIEEGLVPMEMST